MSPFLTEFFFKMAFVFSENHCSKGKNKNKQTKLTLFKNNPIQKGNTELHAHIILNVKLFLS